MTNDHLLYPQTTYHGSCVISYAFPNARFLMSRTGLEDGIEGQAVELAVAVKEVLKDNKKILRDLAVITKQSYSKIEQDFQRDFYLTAPEVKAGPDLHQFPSHSAYLCRRQHTE